VQENGTLRRSCHIVRRPSTALAAQCDMGVGGRRGLVGITLNRAGARRTAKGRSAAVIADEKECLSGVVRIRTRLAHVFSNYFDTVPRGWHCIGEL
jgi:hypothetical protein